MVGLKTLQRITTNASYGECAMWAQFTHKDFILSLLSVFTGAETRVQLKWEKVPNQKRSISDAARKWNYMGTRSSGFSKHHLIYIAGAR